MELLQLPTLTLQQAVFRIIATLLVLAVSGYCAVRLSRQLGDPGPRYDGRETVSPFAHLDLLGVIAGLTFQATWISRLDLDPLNFKRPLYGSIVLVAANFIALTALAIGCLVIRGPVFQSLSPSVATGALVGLNTGFMVIASSAIVSLVPMPPLLGSVIWRAWLGQRAPLIHASRTASTVGGIALLVLLQVGLHRLILVPIAGELRSFLGY